MNTIRCASIGTVIHATLRPEDLIPAFLEEIEYQLNRQERTPELRDYLDRLRNQYEEISEEVFDDEGEYVESEFDHDTISDLCDILDNFAPPYCYFGTHEGDGSDFGFWPSMDAIRELPQFGDLSEVPDDIDEDYAIVNDHGNVTVYGCDGSEIISIV